MYDRDFPDEMTPDERLQELSAILATGFLRLKMGNEFPLDMVSAPEKPAQFTENGLDYPGDLSHVMTDG